MDNFNEKNINLDRIIELVKKSKYYSKTNTKILNHTILNCVDLENICLPFRLKCLANKLEIHSLEELLNIDVTEILKHRNIGITTVVKSRKIIFDYLCKIEDCFNKLKFDSCEDPYYNAQYKIVAYFPLLNGNFSTSRLYFNFVFRDISHLKIPKRINEYIKEKRGIKIIYDLLNINCEELKKEYNIGCKTIIKLQCTLIRELNLERVIFLSE